MNDCDRKKKRGTLWGQYVILQKGGLTLRQPPLYASRWGAERKMSNPPSESPSHRQFNDFIGVS